jgi:hypothetical protein
MNRTGSTSVHGEDPASPTKLGRPAPVEKRLSYHPSFDLFNDALRGNRELLSWAGLKPDQFDKFDEIIEKTWKHLSADLERDAMLISEETGNPDPKVLGEKNIKVYVVEGSAARAEERIDRLHQELSANFGEGAAGRLVPYVSREGHMAGLGRYTTTIKFYDLVEADIATYLSQMADVQVTDPETGKKLAGYKGSISNSIYSVLGTAFGKTEGP